MQRRVLLSCVLTGVAGMATYLALHQDDAPETAMEAQFCSRETGSRFAYDIAYEVQTLPEAASGVANNSLARQVLKLGGTLGMEAAESGHFRLKFTPTSYTIMGQNYPMGIKEFEH